MTWNFVKESLPKEEKNGISRPLLLNRGVFYKSTMQNVINVGECDLSGDEPIWRTVEYHTTSSGYTTCTINTVDDVTHWQPIENLNEPMDKSGE